MRILTYSEYTSKKLSQYESNNIEASSMNKDIAEEKEQLIKENNVKYSSVMIRKDILEFIGKFDENPELRAVEDLDFWIRIASVYKIQFQNDLMGYYFFSEKGTSQEETNHIKLERLYKKIIYSL